MSEHKMPDPFAMFKEMYAANEEQLSKMMDKMLASEAFAAQMGQQLDSVLNAKSMVQKSMEQYCETVGMPTLKDISRVAGQVIAVEEKVDDFVFQFEDFAEEQNAKFLQVNGQVNQLLDAVDKLTGMVTSLMECAAKHKG